MSAYGFLKYQPETVNGKTSIGNRQHERHWSRIARSLAEAGYRVVLNGFGTPDTIDSVLSEIGSLSSSEPIYIGTDLTDVVSIEKAINELLSSEGPVCVLVNNAGMQYTAPVDEFPVEKWDQIIALNLSAAFHTTRYACRP